MSVPQRKVKNIFKRNVSLPKNEVTQKQVDKGNNLRLLFEKDHCFFLSISRDTLNHRSMINAFTLYNQISYT